jgi:hypothetical protein
VTTVTNEGSEKFQACRKLVHDDAFEAKITANMVTPLLGGTVNRLHQYEVGLFLRRALTRYLSITLCRLLDKPGQGRTGETASISSLIDMAQEDRILGDAQADTFRLELEQIKQDAAQEQYDLPSALRDLRNIQLAHRLIPWKEPESDVWGHHLIEFAGSIFDFVGRLDQSLADATGVSLADTRRAADDFNTSATSLWSALTSME